MNGDERLRDLVGDEASDAELEQLGAMDALLRSTAPAPDVPATLDRAVRAIPDAHGRRMPGHRLVGLGLAAALAAATFGVGFWISGGQGESDGAPVVERLTLTPTAAAPAGAELVLEVLPVDEAGNWAMSGDATGLTPLAEGGYYEVWMTVAGELAVSCGRFIVDSAGAARNVWLNAPYDFAGYDLWVVVAVRPGEQPSEWLLEGPVAQVA